MTLDEAIINALRGDAILFTGAGFSFEAENSYPEPNNLIPDARKFAKTLTEMVGSNGEYDLPVIGQYFLSKKGENNLVSVLSKTFTTRNVQSFHKEVAKIPWRRVYTTNYDDCFEFSALQNGDDWLPVTLETPPSGRKNLCVHINGHISNLTIKSLSAQLKLSHSSYSADSFGASKWCQQLRQDMNNAKSVFFIGYSMADIDVARMLTLSPDLCERTFFIVAPNEDEITVEPLGNYGEVHAIGIEKFAELVTSTVVPKDTSGYTFTWLREYESDLEPAEPEDKDIIDLLTLGVVEQKNVVWSLAKMSSSGYVRRTEIDDILKELERGRRWFLLHSDLGNGKTILKHELSHLLDRLGYTVFWDSDFELNRSSDLNQLSKLERRIAIFIDESSDRFEVIDGLLSIDIENVFVFICVRSTLYELGESKYEEYLPSEYIPFDLNRLTESNVADFSALLTTLGLWGERGNLSDAEKTSFIKVNCTAAISKIVLSIFEQSEIGKRIEKIAKTTICNKDDVASLTILTLLLNQIGHEPRLTILTDILGKDAWAIVKSPEFKKAAEFIRFRNGKVKARSSVVSSYLLRKAIGAELLIWNIERFVRTLASLKRDQTLHHIFTELQRFPQIERIIESPNKYELIIGYYQSLKNISFCQSKSLFWLHYGMARLSFGEFKEATLLFDQARSLAKGNFKETTDVNNHFARLLLDSRTKGSDYTDFFDAFCKAHEILLDQINQNTNRHFPFRQAKKYVDLISFRKDELTEQQINQFVNGCRQIISAIKHLQGKISNSAEVDSCQRAMNRAIEIALSNTQ